jgi:hypothetical protein
VGMIFDSLVFGVNPLDIEAEALERFIEDLKDNPLALVCPEIREASKHITNRAIKFWHEGIGVFYDTALTIKIDDSYKNTIAIHYDKSCDYPLAKSIRITVHVDKNDGLLNTDSILRNAIIHPDWNTIINCSTFTDVDICFKIDDIGLDYFIHKATYGYSKYPHIKHNLKSKRRTLYFSNTYYIYETLNKQTKIEKKLKGMKEIKEKLGLIKYSDLIEQFKNKDSNLLHNLQQNIKQFRDTSIYDIPKYLPESFGDDVIKDIESIERRLKLRRKPVISKFVTNPKIKPKYSISQNTLMNHGKRLNSKDSKGRYYTDKIRPRLLKRPNILEFKYQSDLLRAFYPEVLNEFNQYKIYSHIISELRRN